MQDKIQYMDYKAIDHVTSNLSQLYIVANYQGSNQLQVGCGEFPPISYIGHTSILNNFYSKALCIKKF